MWYFTWFIGVTMAVLLAVMHALWLEVQEDESALREKAIYRSKVGGEKG